MIRSAKSCYVGINDMLEKLLRVLQPRRLSWPFSIPSSRLVVIRRKAFRRVDAEQAVTECEMQRHSLKIASALRPSGWLGEFSMKQFPEVWKFTCAHSEVAASLQDEELAYRRRDFSGNRIAYLGRHVPDAEELEFRRSSTARPFS